MDKKSEFITVIKTHEGIIFKVAAFYIRDADDRQDLYQEIVYQLWKSFDSFKGQSKLSTWIYRVALNTAIYALQKSKRRITTSVLDQEIIQVPDDEYSMETEERIQSLYKLIRQLNLVEKGIVLLYLEGKSYQEIAEITGISASNVGTKLSRVKEKMKTQITKNT